MLKDIQKLYPWAEKGKSTSRQFKIQAGKKMPWILRAEYGLGKSSDSGLIVSDGKPLDFIYIPLTSEQLKELAILKKIHYSAYLTQYYAKYSEKLFPSYTYNVFKTKSS